MPCSYITTKKKEGNEHLKGEKGPENKIETKTLVLVNTSLSNGKTNRICNELKDTICKRKFGRVLKVGSIGR